MLSLDYLRFLFKKNKFLILFILLTNLIICMGNNDITIAIDFKLYLSFFFLIILTYILPCINLSYIHNKKAVDSYYALPISRTTALTSVLTFTILTIYIPYFIGQTINGLMVGDTNLLHYLLVGLLAVIVLVSFNSLIYSLANNIFDGIVLILAYNILPLAIYLVTFMFNNVYVAGYSNMSLSFTNYLSPVASCVCLFVSSIFNNESSYLITLIIYAAISIFLLYKTYINRKCERAESISNELFAYPIVIYVYTSLVIFGISINYGLNQNIWEFLKENISLYLITFVIFVVAHFVYKRKFYFNIKLPLYFLSVFGICMIFITTVRTTKAFNIAYNYPKLDNYTTIKLSLECYEDSEITKWFDEELDKDTDYLHIEINVDPNAAVQLQKQTSDLIDKYRIYMIDEYYQGKESDIYACSAFLLIDHDGKGSDYGYYTYTSETLSPTVQELKTLVKDGLVSINITDYENEYTIDENGKLVTHVWVY